MIGRKGRVLNQMARVLLGTASEFGLSSRHVELPSILLEDVKSIAGRSLTATLTVPACTEDFKRTRAQVHDGLYMKAIGMPYTLVF